MSQRLKVALGDAVFSLILYFGAKYANPNIAEDIKFVLGVVQVIFGLWITSETIRELTVMRLMQKFNPEQFSILFKEVMSKES
jgi:hypothetical protein